MQLFDLPRSWLTDLGLRCYAWFPDRVWDLVIFALLCFVPRPNLGLSHFLCYALFSDQVWDLVFFALLCLVSDRVWDLAFFALLCLAPDRVWDLVIFSAMLCSQTESGT